MSRVTRTFTFILLGLALVFTAGGAGPAVAQSALTGEWTASLKSDEPNKIQLNFERRFERGGRGQTGQSFDYAELQGLGRAQAEAGGPVRFSLVREAGTVECEGSFQNGRGSGTFRFTANQSFVAAMKSRGFDFEGATSSSGGGRGHDDKLFAAAVLGVTTALADDLLSAGFGRLDAEDLFKAAIFKVDSRFMREMKATGFPDLGMEELVKARIFRIEPDFVRQVAQMGFAGESFEGLVKMRIFKITPEFISEARAEGLGDLNIEDLVKMRIFNIDREFIRRARAAGVPLEVEELVQERIGVRGVRGR